MENNNDIKKEEEILKGNELIALFMDCDEVVDNGRVYFESDFLKQFNGHNFIRNQALKFHSSYDWLMPVVKKICSLGYDVEINSNLRRINIGLNDTGLINNAPEYYSEFRGNKSYNHDITDTECLFFALIKFITWHTMNEMLPKGNETIIHVVDKNKNNG